MTKKFNFSRSHLLTYQASLLSPTGRGFQANQNYDIDQVQDMTRPSQQQPTSVSFFLSWGKFGEEKEELKL